MKRVMLCAAAFLAAASVGAQNLNPSISVTRDYSTSVPDVDKQSFGMAVPDSVLRFDYKFGYSVFDSPYKGAYEFSPYLVDVRPDASSRAMNKFYLRAGAGWVVRPELDFLWNAVNSEKISLDLYNDLDGYSGKYFVPGRDAFSGNDFLDRLGARSSFRSDSFSGSFGLEYNALFTSSELVSPNLYHSVAADFAIKPKRTQKVDYSLSASYSYAVDNALNENSFGIGASVSPVFDRPFSVVVDLGFEGAVFDGAFNKLVALTPRFVYSTGLLDLDAGFRLGYTESFSAFPEVKASLNFADGAFRLFACVTGEDKMNKWSSLRLRNHFYAYVPGGEYHSSREWVNAVLGIKGWLGSHFEYFLDGGYAVRKNFALEDAAAFCNGNVNSFLYADYNLFHSTARLSWRSKPFEATCVVDFTKTDLSDTAPVFDLPLLSGQFKAMYNWNRRLFVGTGLDFETSRRAPTGFDALKPWYDLSLNAEYKFNRKIGIWLRCGNLLCQPVRRFSLFSVSRPEFIAGISIVL